MVADTFPSKMKTWVLISFSAIRPGFACPEDRNSMMRFTMTVQEELILTCPNVLVFRGSLPRPQFYTRRRGSKSPRSGCYLVPRMEANVTVLTECLALLQFHALSTNDPQE
jgi:hypothetical protein